ncbi:MAG: hypothetical protein ACXVIJ_15935 [Thermoanaerobaculia bacterium]
MPNDIAIAVPNIARRTALASAVQRTLKPAINASPRMVSAIVDATARNGIMKSGRNEST